MIYLLRHVLSSSCFTEVFVTIVLNNTARPIYTKFGFRISDFVREFIASSPQSRSNVLLIASARVWTGNNELVAMYTFVMHRREWTGLKDFV